MAGDSISLNIGRVDLFGKKSKNDYIQLADRTPHYNSSTGVRQGITSELRAMVTDFTDPAIPGFKVFIDWEARSGLFADERYVDSALAYFTRIGDDMRYALLTNFIRDFKLLLKSYDFLFLSCEGLGEVLSMKPGTFVNNEDDMKINFVIRETIDYRVASLFLMYKDIWYDDIRHVEVLPINLRRFNMFVLVYQTGIYDEILYGAKPKQSKEEKLEWPDPTNADDIKNFPERLILPTLHKLGNLENTYMSEQSFKNFIYIFTGCTVNQFETNKNLFGEISNEAGADSAKNNLSINFKYARYYSRGAGSSLGGIDIGTALAVMSELNKKQNKDKYLTKKWKQIKKSAVDGLKRGANTIVNRGISTINQGINSVLGKNTPIGSMVDNVLNPGNLIDKVTDIAVSALDSYTAVGFDYLAKFNNMVLGFDDQLASDLKNKLSLKKSSNLETNFELNSNQLTTAKPPKLEVIDNDTKALPENPKIKLGVEERHLPNPNLKVEYGDLGNGFQNNLDVNRDMKINERAPKLEKFSKRTTF